MRLLLVFLKEPIEGKVKTRLAADVGHVKATQYYKALVAVQLKQLQGLENCRIRFCHTPDDAEEAVRFWLLAEMQATSSPSKNIYLAPRSLTAGDLDQEIDFRAQGDGDLGARMSRAFAEGFAEGFKEIAAIRSDCPDCGARWINAVFARLSSKHQNNVVIGPSTGGGHYLLALKSPAPEFFDHIHWSGRAVYESTLDAAASVSLAAESLPRLVDVVKLSDWDRVLASPLGAALKKALGEPLEPAQLPQLEP